MNKSTTYKRCEECGLKIKSPGHKDGEDHKRGIEKRKLRVKK